MTTQETYTIRDAANRVKVETHVLRYWEEELGLRIGRNDLGHRFYTNADMELLTHVKQWKDQGLQLKAIRLMLSEDGKLSVPREVVRQAQAMVEKAAQGEEMQQQVKTVPGEKMQQAETVQGEEVKQQTKAVQEEMLREEMLPQKQDGQKEQHALATGSGLRTAAGIESVESILMDERSSKAAKLQFLLENLVSRAVQENNQVILKELDYQFRQFEENAQAREQKHWEREEEHYRKLDELLCQRSRRKDKRKRHSKPKL